MTDKEIFDKYNSYITIDEGDVLLAMKEARQEMKREIINKLKKYQPMLIMSATEE